jgi:protein transport protein SEC24
MLVVPEVLDVFSPLSEGFLVNPTDAKASIDGLLEMIPKIFENNRIPESCLFSAIKAVELSLVLI